MTWLACTLVTEGQGIAALVIAGGFLGAYIAGAGRRR